MQIFNENISLFNNKKYWKEYKQVFISVKEFENERQVKYKKLLNNKSRKKIYKKK